MRDYSKVAPQFWTRGSGKQLRGSVDAQLLALYLMTCPSSNMVGIFYVPVVMIAHETGLGHKRALAAMDVLVAAGFAEYDHEADLVWLPTMAGYQIGDSVSTKDNRHKRIMSELGRVAGHRFHGLFVERYGSQFSIPGLKTKGPSEGSPGTLNYPLKGPQPQREDQDQDQDQDQEQNKRNTSEFPSELETPTTSPHLETGGESTEIPDPVDVAPGRATEAPIAPDSDPAPKAAQRGEQAPPSPSLTLVGVDASPRVPADVQAVFDHWVTERGKVVTGRGPKPKLDDKRRKFIAARLKTWPVDDLRLAITGACHTPWNRGEEGGKVFLDLDLILRDADHIERYGLAAPAKAAARVRSDEPTVASPAASAEQLAELMGAGLYDSSAPGSDLYDDEAEEAS